MNSSQTSSNGSARHLVVSIVSGLFLECLFTKVDWQETHTSQFLVFLFCFLFWFICVNAAALVFFGWSWKTLIESYDITKNFKDLVPNLGMDWYLFINTFTQYREYFVVVCSGFIFIFCLPLLIRFYYYPMEMVIMFQLLRAIFNPRPTLQDAAFAFGLMSIARRTLARMGITSVICLLALPVPIVLYVVDHGLWLESGSGNANYMFFQILAYNLLGHALSFSDSTRYTAKRYTRVSSCPSKERADKNKASH